MASYRLFIKPSVVKELAALPREDRQRIVSRIRRLSVDPRPRGVERLSGLERYRVRQGDYRVVYAVEDAAKAVTIFKVGHRREVYRNRGGLRRRPLRRPQWRRMIRRGPEISKGGL